jgi:dTDP-4-dehydrorhamnose 3,5-epimerase
LLQSFFKKTTNYWAPEFERRIAWNDPLIDLQWPVHNDPSLSVKDQQANKLAEAEHFA